MPTLPTTLAARAEKLFGRPGVVAAVHDPSPGLRRVLFTVPGLAGRRWTPGQEIEFRVAEREFRHYTAAHVDTVTGTVTVVFALHASGPGTRWARSLRQGDEVALMGPGGGVRRRPARRELLLGDATAIGLFAALRCAGANGAGATAVGPAGTHGVVEVPTADVDAAADLLPGLDVIAATPRPSEALHAWLEDHDPGENDHVIIGGHANSAQELRRRLRDAGLPRSAICVKAYWATGRAGL